jgi:hypothetical protein
MKNRRIKVKLAFYRRRRTAESVWESAHFALRFTAKAGDGYIPFSQAQLDSVTFEFIKDELAEKNHRDWMQT